MKIKHLFFYVLAALMMLACEQPQGNLGLPKIELSTQEMSFEAAGGEQSLSVKATREWMVESIAQNWVVVSPENGAASSDEQKVTVTVLENKGMDRSADVIFTIGMSKVSLTVNQAGPGGSAEQLVLYSNDFDKEEAQKTYGSGSSYPYLDQFDGWQNHSGTGVSTVTYAYKAMSTRSNSKSDSNYSDYEGSGSNNLFFGSNAYFAIQNITLSGATKLQFTFGTEKYSQDNGSIFMNSEFHIWLSKDANKWVELTDYVFAGGETEGRWNIASANFSVPSGTDKLSICMTTDVASSYRIDDLKLVIAETAGTSVDFSGAVEKNFGEGTTTGSKPESKGKKTVAEFIAAADNSNYYELTGTVSGFNPTYCSFDLTDETGKIYVYSVLSDSKSEWSSKIQNGGKVTIYGKYLYYENKSQHEVVDAYIVSFTPGEGGDNPGGENPGGDNPGGEAGQYDPQGITWTLGTNAYDNTSSSTSAQSAVVNGVSVSNLLKLGKSSDTGDATIHIPAGTKKVGFYALSWKAKPAELKITMGSNSVSVNPPANDGAAGNPPYTITLASDGSDYFELDVPTSEAVDVKVETTDPASGRVLLIGLKAIK
ncbi:MAG: BACON domain-containing protein [Bacteroidales bacterium]|nr:BACON domain-containing protein [Bacteroidales bacterium]